METANNNAGEGQENVTGDVKSDGVKAKQTQHIDDDKSTIKMSTAVETFWQLLYENWIWTLTVGFSTTNKQGDKLAIIPIHPMSGNAYIRYFAAAFNCWVGDLWLRIRPVSTALQGGALCVVRLPPSYTRSDITAMDITQLTTYELIELDPQFTAYKPMKFVDQKRMAYHYMELDENDPDTFGGWVVLFVKSAMVAGSDGDKTINILIDSRGGFVFVQPAKLSVGGTPSPTPKYLPSWSLRNVNYQGTCEGTGSFTELIIAPTATPGVGIGTLGLQQAGTKDPFTYTSNSLYNVLLDPVRNALRAGLVQPQISGSMDHNGIHVTGGSATFYSSMYFNAGVHWFGDVEDGVYCTIQGQSLDENEFRYQVDKDAGDVHNGAYLSYIAPYTPTITFSHNVTMIITLPVGEVPVIFFDQLCSLASPLPRLMNNAFSLSGINKIPDDQSYLMACYDMVTGIFHGWFRMCPNSIITAADPSSENPLVLSTTDPIGFYIVAMIPISSPLPVNGSRVDSAYRGLARSHETHDKLLKASEIKYLARKEVVTQGTKEGKFTSADSKAVDEYYINRRREILENKYACARRIWEVNGIHLEKVCRKFGFAIPPRSIYGDS